MMKQGLLAAALVLVSLPSYANIDTTGSFLVNSAAVGVDGNGRFLSSGQVFTPQVGEDRLIGFSLFLQGRLPGGHGGTGSVDLRGYLATWDGQNPVTQLFESATQTMNAAGTLQAFSFTTDVLLNPGDMYIAYLSAAGLPAQTTSAFTMPIAPDVIPGAFALSFFDFSSLTYDWNADNPPDAWFTANFEAVPEPASLAMLGLGLAALGAIRRRRA